MTTVTHTVYLPDNVKLLTGKYKGKTGRWSYWTEKHPLSSERRAQVRIQTGYGFKTLLVNESNFEVLTRQEKVFTKVV